MEIDYDNLELAMAVDPDWDAAFYLDSASGAVFFVDDESQQQAQQYRTLAEIPAEKSGVVHAAWCLLWEEEVVGTADDAAEERAVTAYLERLVRIPPFETRDEYRDMVDFSNQVNDRTAAHQLANALEGRAAFRHFKEVLNRFPAEWDAWNAFQAKRRRARIDEWLRDEGLLPHQEDAAE